MLYIYDSLYLSEQLITVFSFFCSGRTSSEHHLACMRHDICLLPDARVIICLLPPPPLILPMFCTCTTHPQHLTQFVMTTQGKKPNPNSGPHTRGGKRSSNITNASPSRNLRHRAGGDFIVDNSVSLGRPTRSKKPTEKAIANVTHASIAAAAAGTVVDPTVASTAGSVDAVSTTAASTTSNVSSDGLGCPRRLKKPTKKVIANKTPTSIGAAASASVVAVPSVLKKTKKSQYDYDR
jgi:hypothetical protein